MLSHLGGCKYVTFTIPFGYLYFLLVVGGSREWSNIINPDGASTQQGADNPDRGDIMFEIKGQEIRV